MSIKTRISQLNKLENNLIEIRMISEYKVHISDLLEIRKAFKKLANEDKKHTVLVVPGRYGGLAREAKGIDMLDTYQERVHRMALVVPGIRQKLLAKLYFDYVTKPSYEYKFFSDEESALTWLEE